MRTADMDYGLRRHSGRRTARALSFLIGAALFGLLGCGQRDAPIDDDGSADSLRIFEPMAHHPASGPLQVADIAVWRQPSGLNEDRFYAAVGEQGIMAHLADGAFLQRLTHSAASHLGVLYAMPVDASLADFLVAADPSRDQLTWFEINAGSGALRRLAGQPAVIGDAAVGLCTHSDASAKRHRVLVVTRSGTLQDWSVVAQSGKQPNFANRIVATLERTLPLGGAGGDCAVDPETGAVFAVVDAREIRRVDADWTLPPVLVSGSDDSPALNAAITSIELTRGVEGAPLLLVVDQDGRRLVAASTAGRVVATLALEPKIVALRSAGDSVAVVTESADARFADWARVSARLGLSGRAEAQ